MRYRQLSNELKPLVDKFYRAQRATMRAASGANYWVAEDTQIVAALNLHSMPEGYHWLTGLYVLPELRKQGIATQLVSSATDQLEWPVWLFCKPELVGFYEGLNFTSSNNLPLNLSQKLARYQQTKPLLAMVFNKTSESPIIKQPHQ